MVSLSHKKSLGSKLRTAFSNMKQISNAVLLHVDDDNDVDKLFETIDSEDEMLDYKTVFGKKSSQEVQQPATPPQTSSPSMEVNTLSSGTPTSTSSKSMKSSNTAPSSEMSLTDTHKQDSYAYTHPSGAQLWERQRQEWLQPTAPSNDVSRRKTSHSLGKLAHYNDDVYLSVYRNLVVYNKPLKHGLNMADGFKVIYAGWENTKMFERVAKGGVP